MKTIIFILAISALAAPIFTAACSPAITGCLTCETGGLLCNKADAGYFIGTGKAVTLCSGGMGKAADADPSGADAAATPTSVTAACTTPCTGACNACTAAATGTCLSCKAGFALTAAGVCSNCPAGMGKAADTTAPTAATNTAQCTTTCTGGCQTCGAAASCVSCKAGYYLSAAGTCTWCAAGKGKDADVITTTTVTPVDATGTTACNVATCTATNCSVCGKDATTCAGCAMGRTLSTAGACDICGKDTYWTATNMCTACPAGKTRAAPTAAATAVEADTVCTTASGSGSSATLIQALCGASVAAYALF